MPVCPFRQSRQITCSDGSKRNILYPCGCCPVCSKNIQSQIFPRIRESMLGHRNTIFFTLTCTDDHIKYALDKETGELLKYNDDMKPYLQLLLKRIDTRLRRKYPETFTNKHKGYEYYFCLEYGPNTQRPHLHGIINHNYHDDDFTDVFREWKTKRGYTVVKSIKRLDPSTFSKVAHYVSKYSSKGVLDSLYHHFRNKTIPAPWRIYSSGFGKSYLTPKRLSWHRAKDINRRDFINPYSYICTRADTIYSRMRYFSDGYSFSMPLYYKDKIIQAPIRKFQKINIDGKVEARYVKYRSNTLSLLFELGLARHRIQVYLQQLRKVATDIQSGDFDKVIHQAIVDEERIIQENYKIICTRMNNYYFCKKYRQKKHYKTLEYE